MQKKKGLLRRLLLDMMPTEGRGIECKTLVPFVPPIPYCPYSSVASIHPRAGPPHALLLLPQWQGNMTLFP